MFCAKLCMDFPGPAVMTRDGIGYGPCTDAVRVFHRNAEHCNGEMDDDEKDCGYGFSPVHNNRRY